MRFAPVLVCLAATLLAACSHSVQPPAATAPAKPPEPVSVSISEHDFLATGPRHRKLDVQLRVGQQLEITLGSNPTTGHTWTRESDEGDQGVLRQVQHGFVSPKLLVPGAGGNERWVLEAVKPGTTTARLGYGRSWVQGDLAWSVMVKVQVKP